MKKALRIILWALVAMAAIFVGVGLLLPTESRVERSRVIEAPPEAVFAQVDSLRNWEPWSPWSYRDPTIRNTYNDVEAGVGAEARWTSEDSGTGTQRIVVSEPPERIETDLDFGEMGTAHAYWTFEPVPEGTRVTWGFVSPNDGLAQRWMGLLVEHFVGNDYEVGLARLATYVEAL